MGHCLPHSYMEASHGVCKRQMNGGWTPSKCGVTAGSYKNIMDRQENQRMGLRQDWKYRLMLREMVRRRKLRFFGHVIRRKGLERTIITGKVNGKRKRGRPPTSWLKDIKGEVSPNNNVDWVSRTQFDKPNLKSLSRFESSI